MKRRTVVGILLLSGCLFRLSLPMPALAQESAATALRVGYADEDITPPLGTTMPGYFHERRATAVRDPLRAKALVLSQGDTTLAVVAVDLIGVKKDVVDRLRAAVEEKTKIPPECIFVHGTHAHTGATVAEMEALLIEKAVSAVEKAKADLREEKDTRYGMTRERSVAFIRRYLMKDGTVKTNPGRVNPEIVRPMGTVDPKVHVLAFPTAKTMLVSYGLHPDCVSGTEFSADYPYHLTQKVKESLGEEWNVVYLNACCGNVNHIKVNDPAQTSSYEESTKIGRTLGEAVLKAFESAEPVAVNDLAAKRTVVKTPFRAVTDEQVEWAKKQIEADPDVESKRQFNESTPKGILNVAEKRGQSEDAEILAFRIGPVGLVGLPAEVFVEVSRDIQAHSLLEPTMVIGLTGGGMGYLPHPRGYDEGGYEATVNSARYDRETSVLWADAAIGMLNEMAKGGTAIKN